MQINGNNTQEETQRGSFIAERKCYVTTYDSNDVGVEVWRFQDCISLKLKLPE